MNKNRKQRMSFNLEKNAFYACFMPVVVLVFNEVAQILNQPTVNQHPSSIYWLFRLIATIAVLLFPAIGIIWGYAAWKSSIGKLAVIINVAALVFFFAI